MHTSSTESHALENVPNKTLIFPQATPITTSHTTLEYSMNQMPQYHIKHKYAHALVRITLKCSVEMWGPACTGGRNIKAN